jgi:putative toxin-antitoxin system antitoxin component (TIGR02293 family)
MNTSKSTSPLARVKRPSPQALNPVRAGTPAGDRAGFELQDALGAHSSQAKAHLVWSGVKKRFGKPSVPGRISNFKDLYSLPAVERDALVRAGVPSEFTVLVMESMGLPKERFYRILNLSRSTLERKLQASADMSTAESERVIGLSKLIGQVQAMVAESGDPIGFDAAKWFSAWIAEPSPALGGRKPEDLLETADGREAVARLLAQMQSGAFA